MVPEYDLIHCGGSFGGVPYNYIPMIFGMVALIPMSKGMFDNRPGKLWWRAYLYDQLLSFRWRFSLEICAILCGPTCFDGPYHRFSDWLLVQSHQPQRSHQGIHPNRRVPFEKAGETALRSLQSSPSKERFREDWRVHQSELRKGLGGFFRGRPHWPWEKNRIGGDHV